ncbi:MAG: hypothetical protein HIU92_10995 [Proteobacteria bacterium]|nr:hypothetical protein [Pseudomonadota bacterium]
MPTRAAQFIRFDFAPNRNGCIGAYCGKVRLKLLIKSRYLHCQAALCRNAASYREHYKIPPCCTIDAALSEIAFGHIGAGIWW